MWWAFCMFKKSTKEARDLNMNKMDTFQILQTVFIGFGLVVSIITTVLVWRIGIIQNSINQQALSISDFAEIFLMPQTITQKMSDNSDKVVGYNILIKNVSAYPIYLNSYTLNGTKHDVGNSAIPNNSDSWFVVPIPTDIQTKKEFSIVVDFEDYQGKKYQAEGFGLFDGNGWGIKSKKRVFVE